jgi:hypothetical protein
VSGPFDSVIEHCGDDADGRENRQPMRQWAQCRKVLLDRIDRKRMRQIDAVARDAKTLHPADCLLAGAACDFRRQPHHAEQAEDPDRPGVADREAAHMRQHHGRDVAIGDSAQAQAPDRQAPRHGGDALAVFRQIASHQPQRRAEQPVELMAEFPEIERIRFQQQQHPQRNRQRDQQHPPYAEAEDDRQHEGIEPVIDQLGIDRPQHMAEPLAIIAAQHLRQDQHHAERQPDAHGAARPEGQHVNPALADISAMDQQAGDHEENADRRRAVEGGVDQRIEHLVDDAGGLQHLIDGKAGAMRKGHPHRRHEAKRVETGTTSRGGTPWSSALALIEAVVIGKPMLLVKFSLGQHLGGASAEGRVEEDPLLPLHPPPPPRGARPAMPTRKPIRLALLIESKAPPKSRVSVASREKQMKSDGFEPVWRVKSPL